MVLPFLCTLAAPFAIVAEQSLSEPSERQSAAGLIKVTGTVLMPDGEPAADATVESIGRKGELPKIFHTDTAGRFQLYDVFGNGARLHVSSADGKHQKTLLVPSIAVRSAFASPIELKLSPAISHTVTVLSDGRPVEGALVAGEGHSFKVRGITGQDGQATLWLPTTERLQQLVAWHTGRGAAGLRKLDDRPPQDSTRLSLLAPRPHTIRAVDADGNPISDLPLCVNFGMEDGDWIDGELQAAHVRTDAAGVAVVHWAPGEKLKYTDVEVIGADWKIDHVDWAYIREGISTIHARRKMPVEGRLMMPEGASAEGILITGFGFGPDHRGDIPYARAGAMAALLYACLPITVLTWASSISGGPARPGRERSWGSNPSRPRKSESTPIRQRRSLPA